MKMDWLDVYEIALELSDKFPNVDPQWISFPDLQAPLFHLIRTC